MIEAVEQAGAVAGDVGRIVAAATGEPTAGAADELRAIDDIEGHTSVLVGDQMVLKLFRRLEPGPNPDLELRRVLTERTDFTHFPPVLGWLEYQGTDRAVVAILQKFIPHERDARDAFLASLDDLFEQAISTGAEARPPVASLFELGGETPPPEILDLLATDLAAGEKLGRLTAELHLALASDSEDPEMRPHRFTSLYQRSLYQSLRTTIRQTMLTSRNFGRARRDPIGEQLREITRLEPELLAKIGWLLKTRVDGRLIRIHGDLRLDEVLDTGRDFVFYDFAGDSTRPLSERRLKRSPLKDVADLLRSLHYVAYSSLSRQADLGTVVPERVESLEPWALTWYRWVGATMLRAYREGIGESAILPSEPETLRSLLEIFVIERASRELDWELHNRPDWVPIPLAGLHQALDPGLV